MTLRELANSIDKWATETLEALGDFITVVAELLFWQSSWWDASIWAVIVAALIYCVAGLYARTSLKYSYRYFSNAEFRAEQKEAEKDNSLYGDGKLKDENNTYIGCSAMILIGVVFWILVLLGF